MTKFRDVQKDQKWKEAHNSLNSKDRNDFSFFRVKQEILEYWYKLDQTLYNDFYGSYYPNQELSLWIPKNHENKIKEIASKYGDDSHKYLVAFINVFIWLQDDWPILQYDFKTLSSYQKDLILAKKFFHEYTNKNKPGKIKLSINANINGKSIDVTLSSKRLLFSMLKLIDSECEENIRIPETEWNKILNSGRLKLTKELIDYRNKYAHHLYNFLEKSSSAKSKSAIFIDVAKIFAFSGMPFNEEDLSEPLLSPGDTARRVRTGIMNHQKREKQYNFLE